MLEVRLNGVGVLELASSTVIDITNSSPIFDKDSVDRKFSLPFRIALTPKNKALRKHQNRLDTSTKLGNMPAEVRLGGHLVLSGDMVQTDVSTDQEEVSIMSNTLKVWELLGKIKIHEILESFDLLDGRPTPLWEFSMGVTGAYQMEVDGTIASSTAATFPDIPAAGASIAAQLNVVYPGLANFNSSTNRLELNSFIIYDHPIDGWNLFTMHQYKNLAIYRFEAVRDHVLDTNTTPIASHCFPMIRWDGFPGLYFYKLMNNVIDGVMLENDFFISDLALIWGNSILPCVRIPYILTKIAEALGDYVWAGEVWEDVDFQKLIHVPNLSLDEITTDRYFDGSFSMKSKNSFKPSIILNDLVPQMTAAQFINKLCDTFSLRLDASDRVLSLKRKQTPLQVPPINLDGRIGKSFSKTPNRTDGWAIKMRKNPNELFTDVAQLEDVVTDGGELIVETSTTFFMDETYISGVHQHEIRCATTKQNGFSPALEPSSKKSTLDLTLLFCHELQPDSEGDLYLHASNDGLNWDGDTVGAYSLSPSGEFGLYEKWWKGVIEYLVGDLAKISAYLHAGEIQKLLEWEAARVEFYHPEGSVIAAVKSLSASCDASGVKQTTLELLYL